MADWATKLEKFIVTQKTMADWATKLANFKAAISKEKEENKIIIGNEEIINGYYWNMQHGIPWLVTEQNNPMIKTIELFTFLEEYFIDLFMYDKFIQSATNFNYEEHMSQYKYDWVKFFEDTLLREIDRIFNPKLHIWFNLAKFAREPYYATFINTLNNFRRRFTALNSITSDQFNFSVITVNKVKRETVTVKCVVIPSITLVEPLEIIDVVRNT